MAIIFGAVCLVTVCLIQNIHSVIWVNCCVIFTVVDLVGSMYWMGLTIEISTSLMILLCAGLAVDYAAHIGNEFTRLYGTRDGKIIYFIYNLTICWASSFLTTWFFLCLFYAIFSK